MERTREATTARPMFFILKKKWPNESCEEKRFFVTSTALLLLAGPILPPRQELRDLFQHVCDGVVPPVRVFLDRTPVVALRGFRVDAPGQHGIRLFNSAVLHLKLVKNPPVVPVAGVQGTRAVEPGPGFVRFPVDPKQTRHRGDHVRIVAAPFQRINGSEIK
jgi:hypothetical protein